MPSVNKTLGARFKIEGEEEYKNVIQQLNAGSRTLATEMTRLNAQYKGNTDSIEFLTDKSELLGRMLDQQRQKTEATRKMHEAASKAYADALKQVTESAGQSEEAQAKAKEALTAADRELNKYAQQLNLAEANEFNLQHQIEDTNKAITGQDEELKGLGDTVEQVAQKLGIRLPKEAKTALNGMKGLSAGTVAAMTAAAAAIAAVIKVTKELGQMTLDVAAQVDEYLTESQITGVPIEILQAWDYAAGLIDVDAEIIKGSMTKLTKAMADAQNGSESAQGKFKELGVSFEDADRTLRNSEQVFYDVIDALGNIENQTERDSVAMELLGKSAQDLNPLINSGSSALKAFGEEAKEAGYILDEYQLKSLGEVDDAYQRLQLTIDANKKQIAAEFAPAVKDAMELFSDVVSKAGEMLIDSGLVENFGTLIRSAVEFGRSVADVISSIPGWMNPIEQLSAAFKALAVILGTITDALNVLRGLSIFNWGSGIARTALGWNANQGQYSATQKALGYGSMDGNYYDPETGLYSGNYGRNAGGSDYWRGGLTWVGEAGPELVGLPGGSRIYNAQDSRALGGDTFYITIDAASIREFNDIVEMAQSARVQQRMR